MLFNAKQEIMYIGGFKDGKKAGDGNLYFKYDKNPELAYIEYEGQWKDDLREGKGIKMVFEAGKKVKKVRKYEGYWKSDKLEGKVIEFTYNFKDEPVKTYDGEYQGGKRSGQGILYHLSGRREYIGGFKVGKKSGNGKYYWNGFGEYKEDLQYEGMWDNDKYNGKGI